MSNLHRRAGLGWRRRRCKDEGIDHINRLPGEILLDIFDQVLQAKDLCNLSMVSKRFASLISYHSASTITLQLPRRDSLVSNNIFLRYNFIASVKKFLHKFRFIHTLHIRLTREFFNVDIFIEFMPDNKPPQIVILSSLIRTIRITEVNLEKYYDPLFEKIYTKQRFLFRPLYPGYNACGRWEEPLRILLPETEEQPLKIRYMNNLILGDGMGVVRGVMLSVTRAAWGNDGVFLRQNIRGKDVKILNAVWKIMNWYT